MSEKKIIKTKRKQMKRMAHCGISRWVMGEPVLDQGPICQGLPERNPCE